jgi:uncharacterized protein involved in oxidation of intracellular sulfur
LKFLVLLNDPSYGTERAYNGLRLVGALAQREGVEIKVFLFGDAVGCAIAGQKVPDGYYHLDRMLQALERLYLLHARGGRRVPTGLGW